MSPLLFKSLYDESIETDFSINGEMEWILTTDFSTSEYNEIFNKFPDKEFPIVLENGQPVIDDKGELVRDVYDIETRQHNDTMTLYRMAAQLKLVVKNTDIQEMELDNVVNILKQTPVDIYLKLQEELGKIIKARFDILQQSRSSMARRVLAFTDKEKLEREKYLDELSKERDRLFKESDDLQIKFKETNDLSLQKRIDDIEQQVIEIEKVLIRNVSDGVKTENGITDSFVLLELATKYPCITMDFLIRALKQTLTKDEEIILELFRAKYSLEAEQSHREYEKFNKKGSNPS